MKCRWNDCSNEATKMLFRPVKEVRKDPVTKKKIWNEEILVCDGCRGEAQKEYKYESFGRIEEDYGSR